MCQRAVPPQGHPAPIWHRLNRVILINVIMQGKIMRINAGKLEFLLKNTVYFEPTKRNKTKKVRILSNFYQIKRKLSLT